MLLIVYCELISYLPSAFDLIFALHLCLDDHRHALALVSFPLFLDFLILKIFFVLRRMQQNDLNGAAKKKMAYIS